MFTVIKQIPQNQQNSASDLDEVLVKETDGTFRFVKVAAAGTSASLPQTIVTPSPRTEKPAAATKVLLTEEEQEIATISKKTNAVAGSVPDPAQATVRRVLRESGIPVNPALESRLVAMLIAHVKQVRNASETREILTRGQDKGGAGMAPSEAVKLLSLLNPSPLARPATSVPQQSSPPPSAPPPPPKPVTQPSSVQTQPQALPVPERQPRPTPPQSPRTPFPKPTQTPRQPVTQEVPPLPIPTKPILQDVSFTAKLAGPVQELRMSIADWRRMAPTLKDRATKIEEKLRLLEEESHTERVKGIAAWYASEPVGVYQDIARTSLAAGKSVSIALADRQAQGQSAFSIEEFQSIAELNEKLRL